MIKYLRVFLSVFFLVLLVHFSASAQTDLAVTKTVDHSTPNVGTNVIFTVTATNNGPDPATGVTVQDIPGDPSAYTLVSATGGTFNIVNGQWVIGNLASGASMIAQITATVNANKVDYSNTVTITGNETDNTPGNNSFTVTPVPVPQSDIQLTKIVDHPTPNVNTNVIFTVTAKNNGPSDAFGVTVTDQLPAGYTYVSSSPDAGTTYDNTTGLWTIGNIANGASSVLTITATVLPNQIGFYDNTASVTHSNQIDPTPGNNTADASTTPVQLTDLTVTKTVDKPTPNVGDVVTFTITAINNGPSNATLVQIQDVPGGIGAYTYINPGNFDPGTGIWAIGNLASGASISTTITATVNGNHPPTDYSNTVTITGNETDPTPGNNSASVTPVPVPQSDIQLTKIVDHPTPNVNTNVTFTVTAKNNGPSDAFGVTVTDQLPAGYTYVSSAPDAGTTYDNTTGLWTIGNIATGASSVLTITATVLPNQIGFYDNTASVTHSNQIDPTPGNNTADAPTTPVPLADLGITNTDGQAAYSPGVANTYTIIVSNSGPSDVTNAKVSVALPTGATGGSWSTTGTGTPHNPTGTGSITNELVDIPSGGSITYTYTITPGSSTSAGNFAVTASVAVPAGTTDGNAANDTATDTDIPATDLSVTNTDGVTTYTPGTTNTYTVVVANTGADVAGATVTYPMPAGVTGTWTAVLGVGATGTTSGTGNINETVSIPSGSSITYTITANIASNVIVNPLATTATVTAPVTVTDTNIGNNTTTDNDTFTPVADLQITANTDGTATYTPGTTHTYTVTATNAGTTDAPGSTVTYPMPTGVTGTWTAVYSGGATGNASGTNSINETVSLPSGGTVTYTVTANIASSVTANPLALTATVTVPTGFTDPTPGNNSTTDNDTFTPVADLQITANTDGTATYTPGTTHTYTVTATNAGTTDAPGSTVTYPMPTGVTGTWAAVYSGGATGNASGTNSINETVSLPSGGTVTYTVTANIASSVTANPLALTATVTVPTGFTDPTPGNNSTTDNDTFTPVADLQITANTDGTATYTPGTTHTYTVTATNAGTTDAPGSTVTYPMPTGVTGTWAAVYSGGATGNASGTNSINETVSLPSGGTVTYTVTANIASSVTANPLALTATVTVPTGFTDPTPGNNSTTDNDTFTPVADLQITANTDGTATYTPGTTHTYTVTATNAGTTDAPGSTVTYPMPTGVTGTWAAVYSGGATGNASGTNSINETVSLPSGGTVTYTVTANIASSVTANPLAMTATVTVPTGFTDPTPGNNSTTDNDTFTPVADLQITANTDGTATYTPGTTHTYTVTATNAGTTDAPGSTVTYPMPTGVTGTWAAVYSGGATGNASGTNSINETVSLPSGGTVTYTVTANIASSVTANPLAMTATVTVPTGFTDPTPGNNTTTDNDTFTPVADLQITANTDGTATYTPGTTHTYTVTATNAGTTDAPGSTVTYPMPAGVTGTWAAVYSGGATGNASGTNSINETVSLPSGGTVTYTVTANIASSVTANPLALTATVTVPTGFTDPTPGNNSTTDNDTFTPVADLQITANTDGTATYTPGTTHTYTVTATNAGTTDAPGSTVTYPMPTGVTGTWAAVYSGGATGNASGTNSINETVSLPSGGTVTYTVTANIASSVTANPLAMTATVTVPTGFTDPTPGNNTTTDNDTFTPVADLQITANTDGTATYTPGTTHTYTVTATNAGTTDAPGSTVTYPMPAGVTGTWAAVYSGGATGNASGTNSINETVSLPSGGTVTYTVTANIASSVTANPLAMTATVTVPTGFTDPTPGNNSTTDNDTFTPVADLSITNTDGQATYTPGTTNTYTLTVSNAGPTNATGATITNPMPAGTTGTWTAVFAGGATGTANGTGDINQTVNIPASGTITYTITVSIPAGQTGSLTSTATVTVPTGYTDPTPANNSVSDIDTFAPVADLSVTNTDGKTTYTPGTTNTYTVTVSNVGPTNATGATVTNPMPAGTTGTWTAVFTGGATGTASGTGNISQTVNIPSGGTITYTITVTVPSSLTGSVTSTATVTVPTGYTDPTPANNTAADIDSQNSLTDLSITKTVDNAAPNVGANITFTITATNNGPSDATGVNVSDLLPSGYTFVSSAPAAGTTYTSGTGAWVIGTIGNGLSKTLTITATVAANKVGNYANTATISGNETDATPGNNSATSTPVPVQLADIAVTKTVDNATPNVGTNVTFTITATNNGLSDATNVTVTDLLPAGYTFVSSTVTTGSYVSGTGLWTIPAITHSTAQILTVTATVKPDQTGFYDNTATVTHSDQADPVSANNTAHIATTPHPVSDVSIVVTDGKTNYTPGTTNTYTVTITNTGPSNIIGGTVNNTFPAGGATAAWTTTLAGGATVTDATGTGSITNETVNIPVGGSIVYTYTITVPSATTGAYSNTATVTLPVNYVDPNLANNTSTDIDTYNPVADLAITNTDGKTTYTPGTTNTYTVVVSNAGPTDATGATVTNPMPAGTTGTWTAAFTGGATGTASGTGDINQTVNIPASGTISYTITVNISASQTGSLTSTATVTVPAGYTDPTPANNTVADVDTYNPVADLQITNTDGKTTYTPGTTNTYTVTVSNAGPSNATGATVTNPMPTGTTGTWTAVFTGSATGTANGIGDINQTVNIPSGGIITYTITVTVPSNQTGSLTSTATVTVPTGYTDPTPANNIASDVDTYNPVADLQITNTDGNTTYTPGTTNTYTVTVTNAGPTNATGATVSNPMPAGVTGTWAAVFTGGATGTASGTGDINQTVNMPAGSTITYTVTAAVASTVTGNLVSTATVTVPTGFTDPTPANNTATDTDTQNSINDLQIVKTVSGSTPSINTQVTFTLTVTNNGPSAATGVSVTDLLPSGFTYVSSTPSTGSYVSSSGVWTIGNLGNSSVATLTVVATVNAAGNYTNAATVTASGTDNNPANNTSQVTITAETLPVANNDSGITIPGTAVVIDLLANDVNGFGTLVPSSVTVVTQPAHGTVVINATTGKATYTPTAGYSGTDVFTYTVKDSNGGTSNIATVNITINKPPVANNDNATTTVNVPVVINILSNDVQGSSNLNTSSVTIVQQPLHGTVSINLSTGAATYTSVTNYFGTDLFTYTVSGADGAVSNTATVNIAISDNPIIGLAKFVLSADKQVNGSFNVTYLLTVENFGLTTLSSLSITDNLSQTFNGENISVVNIKSLGSLVVNNAYNGNTVTEMLQAGNSITVGSMQQIQVTVNVSLVSSGTATYLNSATATGTSVTGLKTTDISTDGIKPDPIVAGDVSPSTPTPVKLTKPNEYIPGGFSPNNDGVNDSFVIENAGSRRMDLQVFNRWGNVVYHSTDYKNDWQGISNQGLVVGGSVPDGTYFYVVSFDNTDRREGFITIHR